jgi:hypothetical protein
MATVATVPERLNEFTPGQALRSAWLAWLIMLCIPALMFLAVMWATMATSEPPKGRFAEAWFIGCMIYLGIAVPGAFFWRSHYFKNYWAGKVVKPRDYFKGMFIIWLSMEIGGILALIGCLISNSLVPNILPALVAFMLFTPFWPTGRAMTNPMGNDPDSEIYEHPR